MRASLARLRKAERDGVLCALRNGCDVASVGEGARAQTGERIFTQTRGDIAALWPLLCAPFRHLHDVPQATRRVIALVCAAGILPLAVLTVFSASPLAQYWGLEFYFTLLWAGFFSAVYRTEGVRVSVAVSTSFFTGIVSITILFSILALGFEAIRSPLFASPSIGIAAPAYIVFVGLFEEATKAAALSLLLRRERAAVLRLTSLPFSTPYGRRLQRF